MKKILISLFALLISSTALADTNYSGAYAGPDFTYFQVNHIQETGLVVATALDNDLTYDTFLGQMTDNNTASLNSVLSNVQSTVTVEFTDIGAIVTIVSCESNDDYVCVFPAGFSYSVIKIL